MLELICFFAKLTRENFFASLKSPINFDLKDLTGAIARIQNNTPLNYITNQQTFGRFELYVDENVLIPRHDTLVLCNRAIKFCVAKKINTSLAADVGTGSGAIACYLSDYFTKVIALDKFDPAIVVAQKNINKFLIKNVQVIKSDLISSDHKFDLIIANLPYLKKDEVLSPVTLHEPQTALFSPGDSFEFYKLAIDNFLLHTSFRFLIAMEINPLDHLKLTEFLMLKSAIRFNFEKDNNDFVRYLFIHNT